MDSNFDNDILHASNERLVEMLQNTRAQLEVAELRIHKLRKTLKVENDTLRARCERLEAALRRVWLVDSCECCSGDCPHSNNGECVLALIDHIEELANMACAALDGEGE